MRGCAAEAPQGPRRVSADERLRVVKRSRQRWHRLAVGDVTERDADIAKQPRASRAPQCALTKALAECRVVERQQLLEAGPRLDGWTEGGERRRVGRGGAGLVPD